MCHYLLYKQQQLTYTYCLLFIVYCLLFIVSAKRSWFSNFKVDKENEEVSILLMVYVNGVYC